jgi:antitoxin component YwqK of YwqJK toxin-antitoxin module
MRVMADRSVANQSIWCKSEDGRIAQWTELKNGARHQVCQYQAGRPHGPFRAFHPGGARWIEGQFRSGAKEGAWRQWDKSGSLAAEGDYRGGRLVAGAPVAMAARCEETKP